MKFKSNVEIDGVKFYSVKQIKEMISYVANSDLKFAISMFDRGDDASLRIAARNLSISNHLKLFVDRIDNYLC